MRKLVLYFLTPVLFAAPIENTARYQQTLKMLRCVVCQNQDLLDSQAPLAKQLKRKVRELIEKGDTDKEIFQYLSERYGDFILFKPPVKPLTWVLWFAPVVFLLFALGGVFFLTMRQKRV